MEASAKTRVPEFSVLRYFLDDRAGLSSAWAKPSVETGDREHRHQVLAEESTFPNGSRVQPCSLRPAKAWSGLATSSLYRHRSHIVASKNAQDKDHHCYHSLDSNDIIL